MKTEITEDLKNEIFLGLDVSTSAIGISICAYINSELKVLEITHLKFSQGKNFKGTSGLFLKSEQFRNTLTKYKDYNITKVIIEEPLFSSNNQFTVSTLLRFNGMVSQHVYNILGVVPEFISSYDARQFGLPELMSVRKYNRKGEEHPISKIRTSLKKNEIVEFGSYPWDISKKEVLWGIISDKYPDIQWVYNKNGELKNENFDATDSLVCVLGYINKVQFGETKPIVSDIVESETDDEYVINYTVSFCNLIFNKAIRLSKN